LTRVAEWMKDNRINHGDLRTLTPAQAITYLEQRGEQVGQKTLDMERQAIQAMMIHVTQTLPAGEHLPVVKSEQAQILSSRAYSPDQVALIAAAQQPANALATAIALAAGLRAHELLTLAPRQERAPDPRPAADSKFAGREGVIYTVQGKGGLVREVLIPSPLAERLEHVRLASPVRVTDRGVFYQSQYAIGGGQRWSNAFSAASMRTLGWSRGAHGVRHSYAQQRMQELQKLGLVRDMALRTVSQEMGHFRPEITETYLR
ncbi:TPA: site-specific integrase, partial [Klebsiella pneumoniae]|nr:site-specific integrase [Klebsiella pneumoniae]